MVAPLRKTYHRSSRGLQFRRRAMTLKQSEAAYTLDPIRYVEHKSQLSFLLAPWAPGYLATARLAEWQSESPDM